MIETARLMIRPLTYGELLDYIQGQDILEEQLGLHKNGRAVSAELREMLDELTLPKMESATDQTYLYYTFWIVVEKKTRTIVAELGFKGAPDKKKEIEIGYGTMSFARGKGFMTEAVGAMISWAEKQPNIDAILAETYEGNKPSIRIVEKNGFVQFAKKKEMIWWKKPTPTSTNY